jgi:hypothetical protein
MLIKCVICDGDLDEGEYLYKGKSYCDDCYKMVRKLEADQKKDDGSR